MSEVILWHGTSADFGASPLQVKQLSRLEAFWLAPDPLVAAIYAGPGGVVLPYRLAEGTALAPAAGGIGGRQVDYVSTVLMEALPDAAEAAKVTCVFDLDPEYGDTPQFPRGTAGELSWRDLVESPNHDPENLKDALRFLGVDAVWCLEPLAAIDGDRPSNQHSKAAFNALARTNLAQQWRPFFVDVVGVLDFDCLHRCGPAQAAQAILQAARPAPDPWMALRRLANPDIAPLAQSAYWTPR